jgi:nucleotide-binding universal stress UspA family protein
MTDQPATDPAARAVAPASAPIIRIAAGVDPHPESDDAVVLGAALAAATGAELMLVSIEPDLPLVIPGLDRKSIRRETEAMLTRTRSALAPGARTAIDSDLSIARGFARVVRAQRCGLVVVGSSRHGAPGEVSIARPTRQLIDGLDSALAIAPRGLSQQPLSLRRIAVGYDDGPESRAALATAAAIASSCGAEVTIRGVIDDRIPALGWPDVWFGTIVEAWQEMMADEVTSLHERIETAAAALGIDAEIEVTRGRPGRSMLELSGAADLLVIGSRRWGPLARLLLGGTGEALVHGARCSLLVVPRPSSDG